MSKRTRRYFSAEQKVTLVKHHHLDKVPVSDICDQEKLQPSSILQWQKQLFENAAIVFEAPQTSKPSREQELEARIAQLLSEGEPIGEPETLVRLAADAGLDEEQVRGTLPSVGVTHQVRADEKEARENGISGVPFFVLVVTTQSRARSRRICFCAHSSASGASKRHPWHSTKVRLVDPRGAIKARIIRHVHVAA